MSSHKPNLVRLFIFISTLLFVVLGTVVMIRYAKGYRPTLSGQIKGTGLLSANSYPQAAEVYLNGDLRTATDSTLNLDPGTYQVEIKKDGYHTWSKTLEIEQELVTATDALLIPTSPALDPLTFTGSLSPVISPDGTQIVYTVASSSALAKNGLYVQDLSTSPLSLSRGPRQIASSTTNFNLTQATYTWSPGGNEILVAFANGSHLLLDSSRLNNLAFLKDQTASLASLLSEWEQQLSQKEVDELKKLPDFFVQMASSSATNLYFSPDGQKLLYQAVQDLNVPSNLLPPLPASSTQLESRELHKGNWYVYDLVEDRNFLIAPGQIPANSSFAPTKLLLMENPRSSTSGDSTATASAYRRLQQGYTLDESLLLLLAEYYPLDSGVRWLPDSSHLLISREDKIDIVEYDGANRTTLYAGPFDSSFVVPSPDGSRIITLIQFSPSAAKNLYTIKLK